MGYSRKSFQLGHRARQFWAAALGVHFLFIFAVSGLDLVDLVGGGHTILPQVIVTGARNLADEVRTVSPAQFNRSNPVRQTMFAYSHLAGIEAPYTFFAPNVPNSLKVVFELDSPGHRIRREFPHVNSETQGLRLTGLIESAAGTPGLWRDVVLQMLAVSALERNPEATRVRTIVSTLKFPEPAEFLKGTPPAYEFVCSYDLNAANSEPQADHN